MTLTTSTGTADGVPDRTDLVALTIDGFEVAVPKGTLVIRAAELLGIQIPRFCDHPLLDPVGACRQCLVEVEGQRKPLASCTTTVTEGMVVKTQLSSPVAKKAQEGNLEFLLINHPLDCPVCDKGGECPLQNQTMSNGPAESRFVDRKRTFPKPIAISSQVLLDRERCVLCARCTRFQQQIAGDPFIELFERGALQQVAIYTDTPFESYFSGNTVQICPVGALTGAAYRFRARPFDLVSTPMVCEHCASGCALRTDHRRGKVLRRLAGDDPAVNEEWNCDKGRWAFTYATEPDRLATPLVRDYDTGRLVEASWTEALERAARGLALARDEGGVGVLPGGRLTVEDAYAYAKFARTVLRTNDVDARVRPHSDEELDFLAARVAGRYVGTPGSVSYADLETARTVLLVGFEPEEESPIVFLRLRKAVRRTGTRVFTVAPFRSPGAVKTAARLVKTVPGAEAEALTAVLGATDGMAGELAAALAEPGAVVLVGERLAAHAGAYSAAARLAEQTGAQLAWVPRRAGERGAVDAGALPTLLPGGRRVADVADRSEVGAVWHASLPDAPGRDLTGILTAVRDGELQGLLVGAVDPADCPDPYLALDALDAAQFIVSLELRRSPVTDRADVVLPVAPAVEKSGTFLDWEGRARPFDAVLRQTGALPDGRVLHTLADEMDVALGLPDVTAARAEIARLGAASERPGVPQVAPADVPQPEAGEAVLAAWHWLLDDGSMQDGEPFLAGTAKKPRLHLSAATAAEVGAAEGSLVTVSSDRGSVTLPLVVADLPDRVVWVPMRTATPDGGAAVRRDLAVQPGDVVRLSVEGGTPATPAPDRAASGEAAADGAAPAERTSGEGEA
ncbi:MAG TPA: NADH-quinone oxidoreductase subunit G [Mycobacteriales bacterium]|nr:NADH-quinone oxidoreductase subunit G [Mycobacteriales bacterium]